MKFPTRLTRLLTIPVLALSAFAQSGAPTTIPSPAALLQSGIYQEETVGDLDAAAKIYRQLLDNAGTMRVSAAQAAYRLGMIQLHKKNTQDALVTFTRLTTDFPDQQELIAKAQAQISAVRSNMPDEDLKKIVDAAVNKISTLAETDPQLTSALATLDGLDGKRAATDLTTWFTTGTPEQRRAAIYILWRGPLATPDLAPALPDLVQLLKNDEGLTRGMAALALGARNALSAEGSLADLALHDDSPFARRCAAYALGLLGDPKAVPVLEQAAKDSDKFVAANARAALSMLETAAAPVDFENLKAGKIQITDVPAMNLELTLRDLQRRAQVDRAQHANLPGPDAEYLTHARQTVIAELTHRGYVFDNDLILHRPEPAVALSSGDAPAADEVALAKAALPQATPAAESWLALNDQAKFADAWDAAAPAIQHALSKDQWQKTMTAVRQPLGKVRSRTLLSAIYKTQLPGAPAGKYLILQYQTDFEHKDAAIETITPSLAPDGKWQISGYYIK